MAGMKNEEPLTLTAYTEALALAPGHPLALASSGGLGTLGWGCARGAVSQATCLPGPCVPLARALPATVHLGVAVCLPPVRPTQRVERYSVW